jgi:hypothetical protein
MRGAETTRLGWLRNPSELRSRSLAQLSRALDRYSRSRFFLCSMRQGLEWMTDFQILHTHLVYWALRGAYSAPPPVSALRQAAPGKTRPNEPSER